MSSYKASVLKRFDQIIQSLEELLAEMPVQSYDRNSRSAPEYLSQDQTNRFYSIRTDYVNLLSTIPSNDNSLESAIDYVRNIYVSRGAVQQVLKDAKELKSDYASGLLTSKGSSESKFHIAEHMLRECIYDIEHLQPPYPSADIDRIEKQINSAIRMVFGEESSQYKEIYRIFHPSVTRHAMTEERQLQIHIEEWEDDRPKIINSLNIMIEEIKLLQNTLNKVGSDDSQALQSTHQQETKQRNIRWLISSAVATGLVLAGLRATQVYTHPNKLAIDLGIAGFIGSTILFITCSKWRTQIVILFGMFLAFLALLTGVQ